MFYLAILASILSGISIVISRIINANLAKVIGVLEGTFYNYLVGLVVSLIFLLISNDSIIERQLLASVPLWAYLGGVVGVIVVVLSSYLAPKIPAFYLTLFIFIGQLFFGILLDYFTLNQISFGKIVGSILVLIGLTYNLRLDIRKKSFQANT